MKETMFGRKLDKRIITVKNGTKNARRIRFRNKLLRPQRLHKTALNTKYRREWMQRLLYAVKDTFWEYTRNTKVSGMWLLQQDRSQGIARWIWSTVLCSLFMLSVYLALLLWIKFYSYPILNIIAHDLLIADVAFPGITICSPNVVNKDRVHDYIKTLKIPPNYTAQEVAAGFEYIHAFTDQIWKAPLNTTFKYADEVLRLNNISIYEAAKSVSAGCADYVQSCFWGPYQFPCRRQHEYFTFIPTTSFLGHCCSFNYNPQNLSYVPFSANIFGMYGGLVFMGTDGSQRNLSTGLIVLVHHPRDYVTEAASSVTITGNHESFVEITPIVQTSSSEVLELSQDKRDCLISDDLDVTSYRQAACLLSCQTEAIMKKCHCLPYHIPNAKGDYQECKLKDSQCYSANLDNFKVVKCDACLPNCYDVRYSISSYKTDLKLHNFSISTHYNSTLNAKDAFLVRAFLAKQTVSSIRKVTVMSWIGLLSGLGGVFNLCLGLSMVSLIEFAYYCTHRLYVNYKARCVLLQPLERK